MGELDIESFREVAKRLGPALKAMAEEFKELNPDRPVCGYCIYYCPPRCELTGRKRLPNDPPCDAYEPAHPRLPQK